MLRSTGSRTIISNFLLAVLLQLVFCRQALTDQGNYTLEYVEFGRMTSGGDFVGCPITFKILAPDHVHHAGNFTALSLNFSSYYMPNKPFNFKMKVCGWDVGQDGRGDAEFTQFEIGYAFLITGDKSWAKTEDDSFLIDGCFNALYWSSNAIEFYLKYDRQEKISYSRLAGSLHAVIHISVPPGKAPAYVEENASMARCITELTKMWK